VPGGWALGSASVTGISGRLAVMAAAYDAVAARYAEFVQGNSISFR
jgi:hypothetical protein